MYVKREDEELIIISALKTSFAVINYYILYLQGGPKNVYDVIERKSV